MELKGQNKQERWTEKGKTESKANTERVHKNDEFEKATRRTIIVDNSEIIITTSRQTMASSEVAESSKKKENG